MFLAAPLAAVAQERPPGAPLDPVANLPIPVIAAGGAGRVSHVRQAIDEGRADAICVASLLHYHYFRHHAYSERDFHGEGNVEHLRRKGGFANIEDATLPEIKAHLSAHGIGCRWPAQACLTGAETP